ncbi:MAG: cytochrome c maturation protein CcmE [Marinicaulis sp.]|nr:cytochrome c maturation protein CcmE [Marinicaulis sp.]
MKPTKRNKRIGLIVGGAVLLGGAGLLVSNALQRNISYFYTPSEVIEAGLAANTRIRLGGMVEDGSLQSSDDVKITFRVTDGGQSIIVSYSGILPDLFREGQGVIAQGRMQADGSFIADTILAKHDENYVPKELIDVMEAAKNQS